jgi:hypothetical protein
MNLTSDELIALRLAIQQRQRECEQAAKSPGPHAEYWRAQATIAATLINKLCEEYAR